MHVKLYNLEHSPYATRVRMQIYKKGLDLEILPPPEALRTPEFMARFPMGKIPVLELDDGRQIPDSWVIMEYLEDCQAGEPLRPDDLFERASMRVLARYADTCLSPAALFPMFSQVGSAGDAEVATGLLAGLDEELARLQRILVAQGGCRGRRLHLGDISLAPHLAYVQMLAPMFGREQPLAQYPAVLEWWQWVGEDSAIARGNGEMLEAVKAFFGG